MTPPPMIVTLRTSGMMSSWLSCMGLVPGQECLVQHCAEKLLRVPTSRPSRLGGISEGEVTELYACTLLSRWDGGERARRQGLANLQSHLDETPFQCARAARPAPDVHSSPALPRRLHPRAARHGNR